MLKKSSVMLFALLAISACSKIDIQDIAIYWDAGTDGAVVTHLLSDASNDVSKAQWDVQRFGYACISQPDFGWLRATFEKLCSESKVACSTEQQKKAKAFFGRADAAYSKLQSKKHGGR